MARGKLLNRGKILQINGLVESTYLSWVIIAARYAKFMLEQGGAYTLVLLPFFELTRAWLYWSKTKNPQFTDSSLKKWSNYLLNAMKVITSTVGVGFAIAGMLTIGFGIMITMGYISIIRNLAKAARSAWNGETHKVANNLHKSFIGGLISGGFTLMTFIPPLAWIGGILVLVATGHIILSTLPGFIANVPLPDVKPIIPPVKKIDSDADSIFSEKQPLLRHSVSSTPSTDYSDNTLSRDLSLTS